MPPRDLLLHRVDIHNVGDLASSPGRYVPALRQFFTADITSVDLDAFDELRTVIVGGGGLLRPAGNGWYADRWRRTIDAVAERNPQLLVLWGVGHIDNTSEQLTLSPQCGLFDLAGIRDREAGIAFVPCASALHPFFDTPNAPTSTIAVFHTADAPFSWRGAPAMDNDTTDVAAAMAFCASAEVLLTNSYHGWYWATLAGRRVVLVNPKTSKFDRLGWEGVRACGPDALLDDLDLDQMGLAHPEALAEARDLNHDFARRVLAAMPRS